jgi:uncharacterized protein
MFCFSENRWVPFAIIISMFVSCSFLRTDQRENYVVDDAAILTEEQENGISLVCAELESKIGSQIVVYSISSLNNAPIAEFANRTFNTWGIGRKDYNDGILIVLAVNDGKVRIEVGYGLENIITDIIAQNIIDEEMVGHFRKKEYYEGILNAVVRVKKLIEANPQKVGEWFHMENNSTT